LGFSYRRLAYFNRYFILFPRIFHWDFHTDAWHFSIDISLGFSYGCLAFFNRYFILFPRIFHSDFHMDAWHFQWIFHSIPQDISLGFSYGCLAFSIDISFYSPGYFIAHFIWMPGIFNGYFILGPRIFRCAINSHKIII
jgi:hypothetical protein